jgi:hypothetical protein
VTDGRVMGDIAVARAFGDIDFKCDEQVTLSSDPEIYQLPLDSDEDEFMIVACDGLWDVMSNHEVIDYIREYLQENPPTIETLTSTTHHLLIQLIEHAVEDLGSTDNVSVVLVLFGKKKEDTMQMNVTRNHQGKTACNATSGVHDDGLNDGLMHVRKSLKEKETLLSTSTTDTSPRTSVSLKSNIKIKKPKNLRSTIVNKKKSPVILKDEVDSDSDSDSDGSNRPESLPSTLSFNMSSTDILMPLPQYSGKSNSEGSGRNNTKLKTHIRKRSMAATRIAAFEREQKRNVSRALKMKAGGSTGSSNSNSGVRNSGDSGEQSNVRKGKSGNSDSSGVRRTSVETRTFRHKSIHNKRTLLDSKRNSGGNNKYNQSGSRTHISVGSKRNFSKPSKEKKKLRAPSQQRRGSLQISTNSLGRHLLNDNNEKTATWSSAVAPAAPSATVTPTTSPAASTSTETTLSSVKREEKVVSYYSSYGRQDSNLSNKSVAEDEDSRMILEIFDVSDASDGHTFFGDWHEVLLPGGVSISLLNKTKLFYYICI